MGFIFDLVQYHPDKNPAPDAEEKFKDIRYILTHLLRLMKIDGPMQ
jgi:hypothetical protein